MDKAEGRRLLKAAKTAEKEDWIVQKSEHESGRWLWVGMLGWKGGERDLSVYVEEFEV